MNIECNFGSTDINFKIYGNKLNYNKVSLVMCSEYNVQTKQNVLSSKLLLYQI